MRTKLILSLLIALVALVSCGRPDTSGSTGISSTAMQVETSIAPTEPAAITATVVPTEPAAVTMTIEPTSKVEQHVISHYVIPPSLKERISISNVIIIGQVTSLGEVINSARDTEDQTKTSTEMMSLGQIYRLEVQQYLKGAGPDILEVLQSEGTIFKAPETVTQADIAEAKTMSVALPMRQGVTYLLFLKRLDGYGFDKEYYTGGLEPWRYVLASDGNATIEAPQDAIDQIPFGFIPDRDAPLLPQVEQLIQAEQPTKTP